MAPISWNTKTLTSVPDNTIRKTWDAYGGDNFTGINIGETFPNITNLDGLPYKDVHTEKKCGGGPIQRKRCSKPYWVGNYNSGKVPIGGWAEVWDGSCGSGFLLNDLTYGVGKFSSLPKTLPDDMATNCAGGSGLGFNKYPTKNHLTRYIDTSATTTDECYFGQGHAYEKNKENCFRAGVHYPTLCQLGDYVDQVPQCKAQCISARSTDSGGARNYCHSAYERLCGKMIGDPLKKNAFNDVINSTKNYITEPECQKYCGYANEDSNNICKEKKRNYCLKPESWPDAADYCYDFWQKFPNTLELNQACGDTLIDSGSPNNIKSGKGCGYLCRGGVNGTLDVHRGYCQTKRLEYCTKDNNIEEGYCYEFCKDNPDLCELYLQNEYCVDKKDKLDLPVGNSGRKYSDYCGCMMDTQFYEDYVHDVFKEFKEGGYEIQGISNIRTEPECIYPKCKSGAILTSAQAQNKNNCGASCIQVMLNKFNASSLTGDFLANQSAQCAQITKSQVEHEVDDKIDAIDDGTADDIGDTGDTGGDAAGGQDTDIDVDVGSNTDVDVDTGGGGDTGTGTDTGTGGTEHTSTVDVSQSGPSKTGDIIAGVIGLIVVILLALAIWAIVKTVKKMTPPP